MYKRLSILGSTGSIGTQALDVVRLNGFTVCALTANSRIDVLEEQIRRFTPRWPPLWTKKRRRICVPVWQIRAPKCSPAWMA